MKYFYRLGHIPELGKIEYKSVSESEIENSTTKWIITDNSVNTHKTGSLVFGGVVHHIWNQKTLNLKDFQKTLSNIIKESDGKYKKVGFAVLPKLRNNLLQQIKKAGAKKINIISRSEPNFGNWKGLKHWFITFSIDDKIYLGEITSFSNQEFWAKLDTKLPHLDMKRGVINLKLARSLNNLTKNKNVYDPFCGQGRLLISAMDIKTNYIASDIDEEVLPELQKNYEKAVQVWTNKWQYIEKNDDIKLATINSIEAIGAQQIDTLKNDNLKDFSIVTEGYLGKTFGKNPKLKEITEQWEKIKNIWINTIRKSEEVGIKEIVFCLPYYPSYRPPGSNKVEPLIPDFIQDLNEGTDYQYEKLGDETEYILYTRKDSRTGHLILKLTKR